MDVPLGAASRAVLERGDFDEARRLASVLIASGSQEAEGRFLLGMADAAAGRISTAIRQLEQAVEVAPHGVYRAQLAKLYTLVRRDAEAAATVRAVEVAPPADALARDTIGCVYAKLGDHDAAAPHFFAAVELAPHDHAFRYNLAATLSFLGRTGEAESALETIISSSPDDARAHHLLAGLRRQTSSHNHVARLRAVADRAAAGPDRLLAGYALAKELEDVGMGEEALACLVSVNAAHRRSLAYEFKRDAAVFDAIEAAWAAVASRPVRDAAGDAPILVIGMPRTGTTLVDRILSSHPQVESVGELQAMPLAVKAAAGTRTPTVLDVETVAASSAVDLAAIGRDYLARAAPYRRDPARRFVDKLPGNFFYAGIAARALPRAVIVCLRRHPMDTVLANFRNLFATGSRYYDYSYDLLDIAAYYARFDRLMAFWRAELPGRILELRYEALIDDQEGETRRLIAHCGLEWSDDCLRFHQHAGAVSTPSAAQVRRPIYRDSVARWRRHERLMEPVRDYFEAQGIMVD